jgi:hypothetical protein
VTLSRTRWRTSPADPTHPKPVGRSWCGDVDSGSTGPTSPLRVAHGGSDGWKVTAISIDRAVSRSQVVRDLFTGFADGDREVVEGILADDLDFSTPLDVGLDRAGYFERCWPGAGSGNQVDFVRTLEVGDEVIATYEAKNLDGTTGRNTEIFTFDDTDRISKVEVYFGWTA